MAVMSNTMSDTRALNWVKFKCKNVRNNHLNFRTINSEMKYRQKNIKIVNISNGTLLQLEHNGMTEETQVKVGMGIMVNYIHQQGLQSGVWTF